jgi:phosphoserine phosphatase RsbU/P
VSAYRIRCAEIWGGNGSVDTAVCTGNVTAAIYSEACGADAGGDIYYFSVCSMDKLTRVAIADLRGHGAEASALSGWLYDALQERMNTPDGAGILAQLNELAREKGFQAMTTAVIASYYSETGRLYVSYAGHPPILVQRRGEGWASLPGPPAPGMANLPLGAFAGVRYDQFETELGAGDRLIVYTDGVSERAREDGEFFGEERLLEALRRTSARSVEEVKAEILDRLRQHSNGAGKDDDATLLVVEVAPNPSGDGVR